jgi:hypothetical protein
MALLKDNQMLDVKKCQETLEHHFATVTREEFMANLKEFCPELFAEELDNHDRISESDLPVDRIDSIPKPRVPGQDKGTVTISVDFNDSLPADILDKF